MFDPFAHLNRPVPNYLQELLGISRKRELERFVREIEITKHDFVTLVWNASSIGYRHDIQHHEFRPAGARFDADLLRVPDAEQKRRNLRTVVGQINRIFEQRRLLTAHIFWNLERWHVFYFDQRDMQSLDNHWEHGSHIHFVNFLWRNYDPEKLWEALQEAETRVGGKLHIRYDSQKPDIPSGSTFTLAVDVDYTCRNVSNSSFVISRTSKLFLGDFPMAPR